jgi:multiple sugar transport system permease protein
VLEAAQIDGAGPVNTALRIKLPYLRRSLVLMVIACFAYGTQLFVEPTILTSAFQSQVSSTWSLNQLAYTYATQEGSFGKASALSILLLLITLIPACILIFRTRFYAIDDD